VPAFLFDAVHLAGLPWFATIPAVAVLVRGGLVYYYCTKPAHLSQNKILHLNPLVAALTSSQLRYLERPAYADSNASKARFMARYSFKQWQLLGGVKKALGITQTWKTAVPTYFSLLVMTEAIRVRCGASSGLLQAILSPSNWWETCKTMARFVFGTAKTGRLEASTSSQAAGARIASPPEVSSGSSVTATPVAEPVEALSRLDSSGFSDPTLAVEGLPWCTNLALADPYAGLPVLLFWVLMIPATVHVARYRKRVVASLHNMELDAAEATAKELLAAADKNEEKANKHAIKWLRSAAMSTAFAVLLSHLPAGVLLYVITNQFTAVVQRLWLQFRYPAGRTITQCARPMRRKVRNKYGGVRMQ
jgi:membrane protein insertase Oxa1/YidC/SpoIIIJ